MQTSKAQSMGISFKSSYSNNLEINYIFFSFIKCLTNESNSTGGIYIN